MFVEDRTDRGHRVFPGQLWIRLDEPRRSALMEFHASDARCTKVRLPERRWLLAEHRGETFGELLVIGSPAIRRQEALIIGEGPKVPQRFDEQQPFLVLRRRQEDAALTGVIHPIQRGQAAATV